MSIPKYHEFMKPILEILQDGKSRMRSEIYNELVTRLGLTDEEKEERLPSGHVVYKNRIGWAITYLKKAGTIESPGKASYKITDIGHDVLKENPEQITQNYLRKFDSFREFVTYTGSDAHNGEDSDLISNDSPQELLDQAYKTITSTLMDDLLNEVLNQSPDFFEKLVVDLLVAMGYGGSEKENSMVLGKSGDEGIDGVIKEDRLGFEKIYIQAKRWDRDRTVGRPEIQKFVGALTGQGATKGAFITTAKYSSEANDYAEKQHACKIVLIDGNELALLMIENNLGVSTQDTYYIKQIDSDYFSDE